jgi:phospholipid/cholesterol/gamma-HCH transport system substrate-binding protein
MSKELKIGLIATFLIVLLIWGINFLKGRNILAEKNQFHAVYNEIGGLEEASPVYLNGYEVGSVKDIKLTNDNRQNLVVTFILRKNLKIPRRSKCIIYNADLMGTKAIKLDFSNSREYFNSGDTIPGGLEPSVTEQIYTDIQPIKSKTQNLLARLDSILQIFDAQTQEDLIQSISDLQSTTQNLKYTSENLNQLLGKNNEKISNILTNAESVTANLKKNNAAISNSINNLSSLSDSLKQANLNTTIRHLEGTLANTDSIIRGIQEGRGSLGKLATDDSLYIQLNQTTRNLNELIIDLRKNPGKYVNISVFGKNK